MSKRWLDDERITALTNAGRLRESNCELVRLTSGGVESRHAASAGPRGTANSVSPRSAPVAADAGVAPGPLTTSTSGSTEGRARTAPAPAEAGRAAAVRPAAAGSGIKPGPLTIPKTAPGRPVTSLYPIVTLCRDRGLPEPVPEHRFHPTRRWRLDYAWVLHKVALEVDGGVWTQGRHTRGKGAIEDMEKASEAAILGWRLLYCTPEQAHNGVALDRIIRALTDREAA